MSRRVTVPLSLSGQRLDQALAELFPDFSRARLQRWIRDGAVLVDDRRRRPRDIVAGGEDVTLQATLENEGDWQAQSLPIRVAWRDEHLLVVDKQAGLVVHPGAGNPDGTLVNALLHLDPALATVPRAGIVHRLDKHTTGLLVVARSITVHAGLVRALAKRDVHREYLALVHGAMPAGTTIDAPIGRHPTHRTRMAVRDDGRPAVTHCRVAERLSHHTLLRVQLESGRTHQIRVHLAHIGHPLFGDPVYGSRSRLPPGTDALLADRLGDFRRQALHACRLAFDHPITGEPVDVESPIPDDFETVLRLLRAHESREPER